MLGDGEGKLTGDLLAPDCMLLCSAIVLIARGKPGFDMLRVLCVTMPLAGLAAWPMADFAGFTPRQWGWLAHLGWTLTRPAARAAA
ncbi:MAG: hypothetical protein ACK4S2_03700 [Gemmobacter sp.]|uniref:hypothetical protein n=1 Tax=Gemmobacter sp. TaxID=1898957 RepID=UPI00391CD0CF